MGDDLATLLGVVETADRPPTSQARAAFKELQARLAAVEKRWGAIVTSGVPALNTVLHTREFAPIPVPAPLTPVRAPRPVVE
jgi:hypothetical protein